MRVSLQKQNTLLQLPHGTRIQINRVTSLGGRRNIPLRVGTCQNLYYALFDKDDVDFEISVDNTLVQRRQLSMDLEIQGAHHHQFVVPPREIFVLRTAESNGKKFHFTRHNDKTQDEQDSGSAASSSACHGLSLKEPLARMSQIKFTLALSQKVPHFQVFVRTLRGRMVIIRAWPTMLIEELKEIIEEREGYPIDEQRLLFSGIQLQDNRTLEACGIVNESVLDILLRLPGGLNNKSINNRLSYGDCHNAVNCCTNLFCPDHAKHTFAERINTRKSERGVITVGPRCRQQFQDPLVPFVPDLIIGEIEPFVIEMRLASSANPR